MELDAVERARAKLLELRNVAVQTSARGFVRMFVTELAELRMLGMSWQLIAAELEKSGFGYSSTALRLAYRSNKRRTEPPKPAVPPAQKVSEATKAKFRDAEAPTAASPPPPVLPTLEISEAEQSAVIGKDEEGQVEAQATQEVPTQLLADMETDDSVAVVRTIEVRNGQVVYEDGEAVQGPLPVRVVRVLRSAGRYVPRSPGRSETVVKMEH